MITEKIKNIFSFIDFLHSNIDHFNNQKPLLEQIASLRREYYDLDPKTNFEHKFEREEIVEKGDKLMNIFRNECKNIINAKINELEITDLTNFANNHFYCIGEFMILVETQNYDKEDVKLIVDAKRKYISIVENLQLSLDNFLPYDLVRDFNETLYGCFKPFLSSDDKLKIEKSEILAKQQLQKNENHKETISYFSIPKDFNNNDDWETEKRRCQIHNQFICRNYEDNLENGKYQFSDLVSKMLAATNNPMQVSEYDLLERQFNQIKSIFSLALNSQVDKGCVIEGLPNLFIENKFEELQQFYRKSIIDVDTHLKTLEGLKKRDAENKNNTNKSQNSANANTLADLITSKNSEKLVESIKIHYKNIKGKRLKLLLLALQDLELLPKERIAKRFHNYCKNEFFWNISSYNAMNGYNFNEHTDNEEFENMKRNIKDIIKT
jgi:hypothetical protein